MDGVHTMRLPGQAERNTFAHLLDYERLDDDGRRVMNVSAIYRDWDRLLGGGR
jgi:hypothetical protein